MKRWLAFLLLSVIFVVSSPAAASAETYTVADDIQITLPEGYTLLTEDNLKEQEDSIAALGHSVTSLRSYMEESHIVFIAVDTQNQNQVQLGAFETDFSKDIGDLSGLKADELETIGSHLINGSFEIISINDWVYFKTTVDGLVGYATVQYVTLKNGTLYTLNYYGSDSAVANEIASGLVLPQTKTGSDTKSVIISVVLWVVLVVALAAIVLLLISLFSDLRKKQEDNDVREYIRIKRHWKL